MSERLKANDNPCPSCPYRRDCPSGVWRPEEYEKLRAYDDNGGFPTAALATFLCHYSNGGPKTICKGWLTVHTDSIAVRIALCKGDVSIEQVEKAPTVPLFRSGNAAANAGLRGIRKPGKRARTMVSRLIRRRIGHT